MKNIVIYLLILVSAKLSIAQSRVGFVFFPQVSSIANPAMKSDSVNKNLTTFSGGAGVTFTQDFSSRVGIQTGIIYSSQNQKIKSSYHSKDGNLNVEHTGKKRFDYLKLPLVLRYSLSIGEKAKLVPFAGVQLSYLLKYEGGMVVYGDNFFDLPQTPAGNNYYKKMVIDVPLGLNLEYGISKRTALVFGFKIDYSLTNAANKEASYNGTPIASFGGISDQKQRNTTYGVNLGVSFNINKKEKANKPTPSTDAIAKADVVKKPEPTHNHHHKKDTVTLDGKHHHRHHASHISANSNGPAVSSSGEHVISTFNKTYTSLIKGVVYKKGTTEVLNNTKILLETEDAKVDSSVTVIGGTYTLHVQDRTAEHKMYVYRKGYKPLLIEIPDTLLDRHQVSVIKIQLELDGSGTHHDEIITITANGKVTDVTGLIVPNAIIFVKNNIEKTTRQIKSDVNGNYSVDLKKYSHYTFSASKGTCSSEKINKSTIEIRTSIVLETDLTISCK